MSVRATMPIIHMLDLYACKYWPYKGDADRQTVSENNYSFETQEPQFLRWFWELVELFLGIRVLIYSNRTK